MPARLADDDPFLLSDLRNQEGFRAKAYKDTVGVWTIGYGHARGVKPTDVWTREQADAALREDVRLAITDLDNQESWWRNMSLQRQRVLANMSFNLGIVKLQRFVNTLAAMQAGRFEDASRGMLNSKWARQVGGRAQTLAQQMRLG